MQVKQGKSKPVSLRESHTHPLGKEGQKQNEILFIYGCFIRRQHSCAVFSAFASWEEDSGFILHKQKHGDLSRVGCLFPAVSWDWLHVPSNPLK